MTLVTMTTMTTMMIMTIMITILFRLTILTIVNISSNLLMYNIQLLVSSNFFTQRKQRGNMCTAKEYSVELLKVKASEAGNLSTSCQQKRK